VVVPWVLSKKLSAAEKSLDDGGAQGPQVYNRYYHMFAKGELPGLVVEAAAELGLQVGSKLEDTPKNTRGVEIVQDGWERSNYYVELKLW
jgi:tRNA (uracil-5-)-methyltransferase TRM9